MSWLEKILPSITSVVKKNIPEGLWSKCPKCEATIYSEELKDTTYVCPKCDHHMRISARVRIESFLDEEDQQEIAENLTAVDPLKFKDQKKYKDRYAQAQKATNEKDALIVQEASDGNLNHVWLVRSDGGTGGLCLKQALPYVRVVPSWLLTLQRAFFEYSYMMEMERCSLGAVPRADPPMWQ